MKNFVLLLFLAPLLAAAQEPSPSPSATPVSAEADMDSAARLESLDAAQIGLATDTIRAHHAEAASLDETGMARATLRGLLDGLYPGAELVGDSQPGPTPVPLRSEVLDGGVGFLRPGALDADNLAQLDVALGDFNAQKATSVIIDLRVLPGSEDYGMAAQFAGRFVSGGTALFSLGRAGDKNEKVFTSSSPPVFQGVVAVVADKDASGAAEALAAALRRHAHAMIIGTATSGRAVESATLDLGGGTRLRYAVAEVRVAGLPPLYPKGVEPDLEVPQSVADKKAVLEGEEKKGISRFIVERERMRLNEAALVAGTNPEFEVGEEEEMPLLDRPLQRAVDLVTAIGFFRKRD